MNIRTINYTVYDNGTISPVSPQDAGVAGDHDVTRVVFNVAAITDNNYLYRIQHVDAAGCVNATENLIRTDNKVSCSLPRGWTMVGGTATIQLVITEVDENDNTEAILYTFSGKLYYEPRDPGLLYDEDDLGRGLSGILAAADRDKTVTEIAAAAAKLDAQIATDAANEAAKLVKDINIEARDVLVGGKVTPIVTFLDDDGRAQFPSKWNGIIAEKSVPVSCAISPGLVGSSAAYMDWDTVLAEKALGVDFGMHGYNHANPSPYYGADADAIISDVTNAKNAMAAKGLENDILVYPYGQATNTAKNVLLDYVKMAVVTNNGLSWALNTPPIQQMAVLRMNMVKSDNSPDPDPSLATLKGYVDAAIAQNGWLIFMSHSQFAAFDNAKIADIKALIDYIRAQGAEVVSLHEGMRRFRNPIYAADFEHGGTFAVGVDGSVKGTGVEFKILAKSGDQTDEIQNALNTYKTVMLGDGTFTVTGLTLDVGMTLKGNGYRTKLLLDPSVVSGTCITAARSTTISNLLISGGLTSTPGSDAGTRHGIYFPELSHRSAVLSCWIEGFSGYGIRVYNVGSAPLRSINVIDCSVRYCGVGFFADYRAEYMSVSASQFTQNYVGCRNGGGNNLFTGCGFNSNNIGFEIVAGNDNGHGSCVGCEFNHNLEKIVSIQDNALGFVFSGCHFFRKTSDPVEDNSVDITNSKGIVFSNSQFGQDIVFSFSGTDKAAFVNGCVFHTIPSTTGDIANVWFEDCRTFGGTAVTIHSVYGDTNKAFYLNAGTTKSIQVKSQEAVLVVSTANTAALRGAWIALGGSSTNVALKASVATLSAATDVSLTVRNVSDQYDIIDIANGGAGQTKIGLSSLTGNAITVL